MAYDPNDPKDKAILDKAVADALAEQAEAHEAEIEGLKANRDKLKADLKKARAGEGNNDASAEVERLETALAEANNKLKAAEKQTAKLTKDLEGVTAERDGLTKDLTGELVGNGLTAALTEAKVAPQYMSAVRSLLTPKVTIETVDGQRRALADGKPLGEFVKAWSQGDEGKAFVAAGGNNGGGSQGSQGGQGGGKTMTRAEYDAADAATRTAHFAEGGTLSD